MTLATVTAPVVDPSAYGATILDYIHAELPLVLVYGAAFTAFAIGLAFVRGWIGRRRATALGGGSYDPWYEADRARQRMRTYEDE